MPYKIVIRLIFPLHIFVSMRSNVLNDPIPEFSLENISKVVEGVACCQLRWENLSFSCKKLGKGKHLAISKSCVSLCFPAIQFTVFLQYTGEITHRFLHIICAPLFIHLQIQENISFSGTWLCSFDKETYIK